MYIFVSIVGDVHTDVYNFDRSSIPDFMFEYLIGWVDPVVDGNCGFRCVADFFHRGQGDCHMFVGSYDARSLNLPRINTILFINIVSKRVSID